MAGYLFFLFVLNIKITYTQNFTTMKKVLFVLAIGAFAACGTGTGDSTTSDSTTMSDTSTTTVAPAMPDTSSMSADTTMKMGDTTSMMKDSTKM